MTLARRAPGIIGLKVTEPGIGTCPLATMAQLYGYDVSDERAVPTIVAVPASPIRFNETSNGYGQNGEAQERTGLALAARWGPPADVVLATKVDPDPVTGDFSGKRVLAS